MQYPTEIKLNFFPNFKKQKLLCSYLTTLKAPKLTLHGL